LFAGSSAFLLSFVAVFLSPALVALVLPGDISVVIPYGRVLLFVVVFLLLPLVAGTLVRSRGERLAEKLSKPCAIISLVLFFVVLVLLMALRKEAMNAVGKEALLYMLIFIVISMAVGWFMGGPAKETRPVLATATGMRHVGLSILIALNAFPDPAVQAPLLAFSVLMVPPSMLLTAYMLIRSRKAARGSQK
jgi:BASS family bile acid:Na+ symporter